MPDEWVEYKIGERLGKFPREVREEPYEDILSIWRCMIKEREWIAEH